MQGWMREARQGTSLMESRQHLTVYTDPVQC